MVRSAASMPPAQGDTAEELGASLQRAWGCPAAGLTPPAELPDTSALPLARITATVARAAHLSAVPCTCPLAVLEQADPYTLRVMRAVNRADEPLRLPVAQSLPGGMTVADDTALDLYLNARCAAEAADEAQRKRDAPTKTK